MLLSIYQAVRVEDGPLSFSLSFSQMAILLTTVKKLLHSTLHICPEVSGFVDLFELQSLCKSEDLYFGFFSLELAQKWHFGFFLLLILTHLLELKAHDSTNSWGDKTPEKQYLIFL